MTYRKFLYSGPGHCMEDQLNVTPERPVEIEIEGLGILRNPVVAG